MCKCYLSVSTLNIGCGDFVVPAVLLRDGVPLGDGSVEGYARKSCAIHECTTSNVCYAVGNGYACQSDAIEECISANARYAASYHYARKTRAVRERVIADTRDTIRNGDAGKTITVIERKIADARYTIVCRNNTVATTNN